MPAKDQPFYPAYILEAGSSLIPSNLATTTTTTTTTQDKALVAINDKEWMALKVKIYSEPSFKVLKPLVLDKAHQLDESRHAFSSPLFSWTAAKLEKALPTIIKGPALVFNLPGASTKLNAIKNFDKDGWIKETITTIDRSDIPFKSVPSGPEDMHGRDALALRMCLGLPLCSL